MKVKAKNFILKLKIVVILILISMLVQTFSPFISVIKAATPENQAPNYEYLVARIDKSEDAQLDFEDFGIVHITLEFRGNLNFSGFDVAFNYNPEILKPTYNAGTNRKPRYEEATNMSDWEATLSEWGSSISENNSWLFTDQNKFRVEGTTANDKNPSVIGEGVAIADMYFLAQGDYNLDNIPSNVFTPAAGNGLDTGIALVYDTYYLLTDHKYYGMEGAKEAEKEVDSVTVKTPPTKVDYNHGDTINLDGGVLTVTYTDGSELEVNMTDPKVSIVDGNPANVNKQTIKLNYEGKQTSFNVTVKDPITSLEVTSPMTDIEYNHGEAFDFTGLELTATKKSGATETLTSTSPGITISETSADVASINFNKTSPDGEVPVKGSQKIIFTYEGKTANQTVVVNDTISQVALISQPNKKVYKRGEALDLTGAKVRVTLESTSTVDIDLPDGSVKVSTYTPTLTGSKQNLTVTVGSKTADDKISVEAYNYIKGIDLTPPSNRKPTYNTEIDLTGSSITENWADTKTVIDIPVTSAMLSGYNKTKIGTTQTITVTYPVTYTLSDGSTINDSFTKTFNVTVQDVVKSITITAPEKATYNHGETLATNGTITVETESGASEEVTMTQSMIFEADGTTAASTSPASYDSTQKVAKTLKIKYSEDGKNGEVDYPITIINDIKEISMHTTPKTQYNVNDTLDVTGGEILVKRAVGIDSVVSLEDSNVLVEGFVSNVENMNLPLTVKYTENGITKQTSYNVSVKDSVKSISIKTLPKTDYRYNEELSVAGGEITVVSGSGTKDVNLTTDMVTGYDKTATGEQTLTVTYGGKTATYKVNVKDYVTGITVEPNEITGNYNDTLADLITAKNIKYTVTYAKAGAKTPANDLVEEMVSGYSATSIEEQNLTVTYTDNDANSASKGEPFTANLKITLADKVKAITITAPEKATYNHGEGLATDGTITVETESGASKTVPMTVAMIFEADGTTLASTSPASYDSTNKVQKTLKIKYSEDGKDGEVEYPITIINDIKEISMHTTPKTQYNVNDTLDVTGGEITVKRAAGTDSVISLEDSNVTVEGFVSNVENNNLSLTVKYTENGITKDTSYIVTVTDEISSMEIDTIPDKTNYKYGETLDVTGGRIKVVKNSGTQFISITKDMVKETDGTEFNSTILGTRNLNVTYGGITKTYEITVKDYVLGITLTPPTKIKYEYGEKLDLTGGSIQKVMASGTSTTPVDLTDSNVTLSTFNPNKEGAQTIDVTYEGFTESFGVTVEDNIQSIIIKTTPKTAYKYGEQLDVTGGEITAIKSSGKTEDITLTNSMVSGYNPNQLGTQTLTIKYKDKEKNYTITVADYVKDIAIKAPDKLVYKLGESLDLTGGTVTVIMASGTSANSVPMSNVMVSGFESSTEGAKTVNVTYEGFTKSFGITVVDPLSDMKIKTLPNKLNYKYGESLDLTGGTIEITKESGTTEIIVMTQNMISGYNPRKLGNQTVKVTYGDKSQEFIVNVEDYISHLKVVPPTKTSYEYGESLELAGGEVSIIMASGKVLETAKLTASMISEFNSTREGTQTINIEYKDLKGSFAVKVIDEVKSISMATPPNKVNYKNGEAIDLTGATITLVKSSGIYTIPVTNNMISGYSPTTPGNQLITVTYGGKTTNFVVNVAQKEVSKRTQSANKTYIPVVVTKEETHIPENLPQENIVKEKQNNEKTKEKPTKTLGVKDKKQEQIDTKGLIEITIGTTGVLLLLLLLLFRRNVKIYVEEEGEFVLGGLDKLTKKNLQLNIDRYLDETTYPNKVKIILNDLISDKLDGKQIEITHRGNTIKHTIKYNDEPYEIILDKLDKTKKEETIKMNE